MTKKLESEIENRLVAIKSFTKTFQKQVTELFDKIPDIVAVKWTQYVPVFNDGDACEFTVLEPRFRYLDSNDKGGYHDDGFYSEWDLENTLKIGDDDTPKSYGKCHNDILKSFESFLDNNYDGLQVLFESNVKITIHRNGTIETEKYTEKYYD